MILPSKTVSQEKALLTCGAEILRLISEPKTISRLWNEFKTTHQDKASLFSYDWFILALDLLFIIHAIELVNGKIRRGQS